MAGSAVIVSLRVQATPQRAFEVFTQEIALWWKPDQLFQLTPRGDGALRFEPGENGRLVTDLPNGKTFEIGRVTIWQPGQKLAFDWRIGTFAPEQKTHVTVTFEAVGVRETRVSIEHRGWESVPQEHVAKHGFPERIFLTRQGAHWRALLAALNTQIAA
ncbi:MAG: SRPBCC domain-containing protein [Terricaulis sp.]